MEEVAAAAVCKWQLSHAALLINRLHHIEHGALCPMPSGSKGLAGAASVAESRWRAERALDALLL